MLSNCQRITLLIDYCHTHKTIVSQSNKSLLVNFPNLTLIKSITFMHPKPRITGKTDWKNRVGTAVSNRLLQTILSTIYAHHLLWLDQQPQPLSHYKPTNPQPLSPYFPSPSPSSAQGLSLYFFLYGCKACL